MSNDIELVRRDRGRPSKWNIEDNDRLNKLIDGYFEECKVNSVIPTITGLALVLDCDMETIRTYSKNPDFSSSIKRAYNYCFNFVYNGMLTAKNPAGFIFAAKNYGMTDNQTIDHTITQRTITVTMLGDIEDD
jgi:hypothetical protein